MTKADRLAREAAKSAVDLQDAAYDDESCDSGDVRLKFTLNDTTYHIAVNKPRNCYSNHNVCLG